MTYKIIIYRMFFISRHFTISSNAFVIARKLYETFIDRFTHLNLQILFLRLKVSIHTTHWRSCLNLCTVLTFPKLTEENHGWLLSQDSLYHIRYSNRNPPEYKSGLLPLSQPTYIGISWSLYLNLFEMVIFYQLTRRHIPYDNAVRTLNLTESSPRSL
jgi:hypothetical protein